MNTTSMRKPIVMGILLALIIGGAVYYFRWTPAPHSKFSTSYQDFPEPKPVPEALPETLVDVPGTIRSFAVSPDGTTIAIATSKGLVLYDLNSLEMIHILPIEGSLRNVAFSPDGSKLAVSQKNMDYYEFGFLYLLIFDTTSWNIQAAYQNDIPTYLYASSGRLAWNPDGKRIAFAIPDQGLTVWNIETNGKPEAIPDFVIPMDGFAWSPDGTRLISTESGYGLRRWRMDTGEWVRLYDSQSQPPAQVQWSPDGKRIVSGHFGGTVCVWSAGNNQCEGFIHAHFNSVDGLDWSPDSEHIATSSGAIRIWDANTGEETSAFGLAKSGIIYNKLEWFEEQTIATLESSYEPNTLPIIRVWDTSTGDVKFAFRGWQELQSLNNSMILRVDDVQISEKETQIQASLFFDIPNISVLDWNLTLKDDTGKSYPLTRMAEMAPASNAAHLYRTTPLPKGMRFTLELNKASGLPLVRDVSGDYSSFMFDPSTLTVGESVELNQELYAGDFSFYLTNAEKISPIELRFDFFTGSNMNGIRLDTPYATGSFSSPEGVGRFSATLTFPNMPGGRIEFIVEKVYYDIDGPWTVEFEALDSMFVK